MSSLTIKELFQLYEKSKERTRQAILDESDILDKLAEVAGSKTFAWDGKLYQIRSRYNKDMETHLTYICELKTTPTQRMRDAAISKLRAAGYEPEQLQEVGVDEENGIDEIEVELE